MNTSPAQVPHDEQQPRRRWRAAMKDLARVAVAALVGGAVAATVVRPALDRLVTQTEIATAAAAQALEEARAWQKSELEALHDITVAPTNDKLFAILSQGVGVAEDVVRTTTVGTTPAAAFATDLTAGQQTNATTQEIVIQNTDAHSPAQNLCVSPIAWSVAGATCTLKCAGSTLTCSAAATDGWLLPAGSQREFRFDGTSCVCVEGSAASTAYQSERVIR